MKRYLIRFVQVHETFRIPELRAVAHLLDISLHIEHYDQTSPFCIIHLISDEAAKALLSRLILSHGVYELWAQGTNYASLHSDLAISVASLNIDSYQSSSFRFDIDCFQGKHSVAEQRDLIESFSYLPLDGPIRMRDPELSVCVFEDYAGQDVKVPRKLYLGRWVGASDRHAIDKYNLKKRRYISRTSMDAELSLVTANLTHAAPGRLIYDPFVGTGSFSVACAHFGAAAFGSDIDGRSMRGSGKDRNLYSNFVQYGSTGFYVDSFVADLTHTPLRETALFDGIICDPPYGVREGPKILGSRHKDIIEAVMVNGKPAHLQEGYVPPRKPYAFDDMLSDVLDFSYLMLSVNGRLSMWVPTANDEDVELLVPTHPGLELVSVCVQPFNKWARRLLTYRKLRRHAAIVQDNRAMRERQAGTTANDLNSFRRKYFAGFVDQDATSEAAKG